MTNSLLIGIPITGIANWNGTNFLFSYSFFVSLWPKCQTEARNEWIQSEARLPLNNRNSFDRDGLSMLESVPFKVVPPNVMWMLFWKNYEVVRYSSIYLHRSTVNSYKPKWHYVKLWTYLPYTIYTGDMRYTPT